MSKETKVQSISEKSYTPAVMAHDIPWSELDAALVVAAKKNGDHSIWISHMTFAEVSYLKVLLDAYLMREFDFE
jgi:hypothetical protein